MPWIVFKSIAAGETKIIFLHSSFIVHIKEYFKIILYSMHFLLVFAYFTVFYLF